MNAPQISRFPIPALESLPDDVRARTASATRTPRTSPAITALFALSNRTANVTAMRPNDESYLMGRVPRQQA